MLLLRQRVQPQDTPFNGFVASVVAVPAGVTLAGRRRLRQALPAEEWLQVVMVVGGPEPLKMYESAQRMI